MDPISFLHARPKAWLAASVLAPHAAAFSSLSDARSIFVPEPRHLPRESGASGALDEPVLSPPWSARRGSSRAVSDQASTTLRLSQARGAYTQYPARRVHSLLKVLRERRVIADRAGPSGPIAEELDRYDAHLREARGLSEGTRRSSLRLVQRLLRYKFTDGTSGVRAAAAGGPAPVHRDTTGVAAVQRPTLRR